MQLPREPRCPGQPSPPRAFVHLRCWEGPGTCQAGTAELRPAPLRGQSSSSLNEMQRGLQVLVPWAAFQVLCGHRWRVATATAPVWSILSSGAVSWLVLPWPWAAGEAEREAEGHWRGGTFRNSPAVGTRSPRERAVTLCQTSARGTRQDRRFLGLLVVYKSLVRRRPVGRVALGHGHPRLGGPSAPGVSLALQPTSHVRVG